MTQRAMPEIPKGVLTEEQVQQISGGCTYEEISQILDGLKDSYDKLVDFTSYVIERVAES